MNHHHRDHMTVLKSTQQQIIISDSIFYRYMPEPNQMNKELMCWAPFLLEMPVDGHLILMSASFILNASTE